MNERELRRILQLEFAKTHEILSEKFTSDEYHRTCDIVNENIVEMEMENWGRTEDALDWATGFFRRFCVVQEPGGKAFMNNPMSIESMLLDRATKTEIALRNSISEEIGAEIANVAVTDFDTFGLARDLVKEAAIMGRALPPSLHSLAEKIAHGEQPPRKRGDNGWKILNRNRIGSAILLVLTHENGFAMNPTRSSSTSVCACDVLKVASSGFNWASFTEASADENWRNRKKLSQEFALLIHLTQYNKSQMFLPPGFALRAVGELRLLSSG